MAIFEAQTFTLKDGRHIVIRHCSSDDAPLLPEFMAKIAQETMHTLQYEGKQFPIEQVALHWKEAEGKQSSLYLGAFTNEQLVAQIHIHQIHPNHPWAKHIGSFGMMVLKEYWGQGLGSQLMVAMETFAQSLGITRIEATVRCSNDRGVQLYKKFGYEIEGVRRHAALIHGEYQDEYHIAKLFDKEINR